MKPYVRLLLRLVPIALQPSFSKINFIVVTGIEMPCRLVQPNFWTHPTYKFKKTKYGKSLLPVPSTNLIMIGWSIGLSSCLQSMVRAGISVGGMTQ